MLIIREPVSVKMTTSRADIPTAIATGGNDVVCVSDDVSDKNENIKYSQEININVFKM